MKKIVFIFFQPPTIFHEQNYYFNELLKVNFEVEVWDITNIIFGDVTLPEEIVRYYIKKLYSKQVLFASIGQYPMNGILEMLSL